ncbi:MAG: AmmeMemoRadiSam system protein B [Bacteroidales bacterium]|nr:AmmeMemoRadiSam system protein B [Bacteroidales bacterium]MBN2758300.1 AmmeMemoRadiSam system protein B [Bacteroidales bacterium]
MSNTDIRNAVVAGRFYPKSQIEIENLLSKIYEKEKSKINLQFADKEIFGAVVPHAGYMFSAYQAIHFFDILKHKNQKYETFIIINPNHTGFGAKIALDSHKFWQTPFGNAELDSEFMNELGFEVSPVAHENEHSGEVMLPFLQYFLDYKFKIVPITLSEQCVKNSKIIAERIKQVSEKLNRKIMVIASSDFTHFKSPKTGYKLDDLVLEQIENQDVDKLEQVVRTNKISVCGFGPIMALMEYSKLKGNYKSEILARGHSGQVIPSNEVVDYISILFYEN